MRKTLVCAAAAACVGMAAPAMAGGMYEGSMKDSPVVTPAASWTGFYIGGGVGAGAVVHELDVNAYEEKYKKKWCGKGVDHVETAGYVNGYDSASCGDYYLTESSDFNFNFDGIGGEGIFGTLQIGYDWQFAPRGVFGFFADADLTAIETDLDFSASTDGDTWLSGSGEMEMDYMWTIGARLGYLATPDTLLYLLAGYSQAEFDDPSISINYDGGSDTFKTSLDTFSGVTVGLGMETRLDHNWGLKLEYRFTQFSDEELFSFTDGDYYGKYNQYYTEQGISADLEPSLHTGRVVLTYRFGERHEALESLK